LNEKSRNLETQEPKVAKKLSELATNKPSRFINTNENPTSYRRHCFRSGTNH